MQDDISVLVTGAGAPGVRGTLYALRSNPDGVRVRTIGVDLNDSAIGRHMVDIFSTVPPPEDESYLTLISEICREYSVDVVLPQTTREIEKLSAGKDVVEESGARIMVSDHRALTVANNKHSLLLKFKEMGLPHPEFVFTTNKSELVQAVTDLGYPQRPVVVKPPISNGMRGLRVLKSRPWTTTRFLEEKPSGLEISLEVLLDMLGFDREWPPLLVSEYLPGTEYSVDAFLGSNASIAIPRRRDEIRSGISFANEIEYRQDLIQYTLLAATRIGLKYAFGFQFKVDVDGVPKVIECNPRVQGTMVASLFAGVNVIWLSVRELMGLQVTPLKQTKSPAEFYRFWGGIGVNRDGTFEI